MWVVRIKPGASGRAGVLLSKEPSLQPQLVCVKQFDLVGTYIPPLVERWPEIQEALGFVSSTAN